MFDMIQRANKEIMFKRITHVHMSLENKIMQVNIKKYTSDFFPKKNGMLKVIGKERNKTTQTITLKDNSICEGKELVE